MLLVLLAAPLWAQKSREQLEQERRRIQQEVKLTRRLLARAQAGEKQSLQQVQLLQKQILLRERLVSTIAQEVGALEDELVRLDHVTTAMRSDVARLQRQYAKLVYVTYKSQDDLSALLWVLSADSFEQAYRRLMYFREFSRYRNQQIFLVKRARQRLVERMRRLNERRDQKQRLLSTREQERAQLSASRAEKDRIIRKLGQRQQVYRRQLGTYQKNLRSIQVEINRLIRAEIARAERANRSANKATRAARAADVSRLSSLIERNKGRLPWPVAAGKGTVTSYFGVNDLYGGQIRNDGIILQTEPGTAVRAVFGGKVSMVQRIGATGTIAIIVQHGRMYTVYNFNAAEVKVKRGDEVTPLQELGSIAPSSPQLQFCIFDQFKAVDPLLWIARGT